MNIHAICVAKNEADVIAHTLRQAAQWADSIYVFDTGSSDGTWETVCDLANSLPCLHPFRHEARPFDDALRSEVFNAFRHAAGADDWWCRLDADEIYIDDPRAFLAGVRPAFHVVWGIYVQFYLTVEEAARFEVTETVPLATAETLPRHYLANHSEPRFFRHRPRLVWEPNAAWPRHMGLVEPHRIRFRHFQYRSPAQIALRLQTRREAAAHGWQHFAHGTQLDWHEKLGDPSRLHLDRGDGQYVIDETQLPHHLEPRWTRLLKRLMHGTGLWP
jgi:hypothetical protein